MVTVLRVVGGLVAGVGALNLGQALGGRSAMDVGAVAIAINLGAFIMPGLICVGIAEVLARLERLERQTRAH